MKFKEPFAQERLIEEKNYEENINKLKNNLGTNVGKLVDQIIKIEDKK